MWNLRVVKIKENEDTFYEVSEVYYDSIGKPVGYARANICGESVEELHTYLEWAKEALSKPVLEFKHNNYCGK